MTASKILIVEDDFDGQDVVSRILRYHRFDFDVAQNGEDALRMVQENHYDGVIIDLALPGIDGWTLLSRIRKNGRLSNLPCVAVTAYHSAELAVKALEHGFTLYFPKPLDTRTLVRELQQLVH
jgi:CheY-like chemotaxis protein